MAKLEKQYPDFECVEYDYGDLAHREYYGTIHAHLKFADEVKMAIVFEFKDFLDFHKRKKSECHRVVERIYRELRGWGSRYFELIEILQDQDEVDLFELFAEYIELTVHDFPEMYQTMRFRIQNRDKKPLQVVAESQVNSNSQSDNKKNAPQNEEITLLPEENDGQTDDEDDDDDEESPYDKDRKKFHDLVQEGTDEMFEALKHDFFPQMEYFQRRYPSKWKTFMLTIENLFYNFENELIDEMMPELNEEEYREFDIKYNSQKADMSDDEIPPDAR